jgi:uncharacterized protein (DUF934 family)
MLVKGGRIADDPFTLVADGAPVPPDGAIIVSLKRFLEEHDALLGRGAPLGVKLESSESPEPLGAHVHMLAVVVLSIPYFKDGRIFSWARLLRTRLGYKGEIRASGHFLRDQIAFLTRVGVDAFELTQNLSADDIAAAVKEMSFVYQPSVDGRTTIRDLRAGRSKSLA